MPSVLGNCYRSCIDIARSEGRRDIAFPAIATLITTRSVTRRENALPGPSALIETFSLYFLFSSRAVAPILAAFSFVAPEN
jgi:hypothetical protein